MFIMEFGLQYVGGGGNSDWWCWCSEDTSLDCEYDVVAAAAEKRPRWSAAAAAGWYL